MKKLLLSAGVLAFMPMVAYAQTLGNILETVGELVDTLIPIVVALALLFFFWGLAQYILKAGDEEGRAAARNTMIWGIIALFVIVSVWGLVQILQTTFDVQDIQQQDVPEVQLRP